jgi:NADH-quinone oxidoreductase subunit C
MTTTTPATPVEAVPTPPTMADRLVAAGVASAVHKLTKDGIDTATVACADYAMAASALQRLGYTRFIDTSVVDLVETGRDDRFMVYALLYSMTDHRHVRIQTTTAEVVASLTPLFAGAHNYEREAFDLFGVRFEGHPNLTRIMLPDGWQGHPMRRDAPNPTEPVDFTITRAQYNT